MRRAGLWRPSTRWEIPAQRYLTRPAGRGEDKSSWQRRNQHFRRRQQVGRDGGSDGQSHKFCVRRLKPPGVGYGCAGNIATSLYDGDGRILATINALGFATTQVYDAVGQRLAIIDARGNRTSFTWDADGRQTGTIDALGNMMTYQYDVASRLVLRIDGRGLLTSYVYDAASRLIGQQYQDGTRATMTYDADSRRTVLSDWTGLYSSTYDPDSRLSSVVNPAGIAITYTYRSIAATKGLAMGELRLAA